MLLDIFEEHLEEADFLFQQRVSALSDRSYNLNDLAQIEERLLAHLDGLVLGESPAWKLLEPKLAGDAAGEVFAAAFTALESSNLKQIAILEARLPEAEGSVLDGIRQALYHAPTADIERILRPCLVHERGPLRATALDVIGFRRRALDPSFLRAGLRERDSCVVVAAAKAAGQLRITGLKGDVEEALENDTTEVRLAAIQAGLLIKSEKALHRCRKEVQDQTEGAAEAILLLGSAGHLEDGSLLLNALSHTRLARSAVRALGLLGFMAAGEALVSHLAHPQLGRLAGEALSTLTGLNLEKEGLAIAPTDSSPSPPSPDLHEGSEGEDEGFQPDPDESLPIPDLEKAADGWRKNASRFAKKGRYRNGQPYSLDVLMDRLKTGTLPERHAVAFELALMDPSRPFLETRAFSARQKKEMVGW